MKFQITNIKLQISKRLKCIENWKLKIGNYKFQEGFTMVELAISMGVFAILVGFITINLNTAQHKAQIAATVETLLVDLGQQQIKAMVGDTEGRSDTDTYGIYFDTDKYTLFHGTYSVSEPTNFSINMPEVHQVITIFPNSEIIFLQGSGEVANFNAATNEITVEDISTGEQKVIEINRYGVVTGAN